MKPRVLATVLCGALTVACGQSGSAGGENLLDGGTYTTSIPSDPGNLDPHHIAAQTAELVTSFAYDSLVGMDERGDPVPRLAAKWDVTPTSVTFTLHEGITCGDGTALTASQVAANFDYVRDPEKAASTIGTDLPDTEFTVTADDTARTVTIEREQPYGFLLPGAGGMPIVCAKGMADRKSLASGTDGTGPFKLVEAVAGDHYTFAVRKEYRWGPDGAKADVPGFPAKVVVKVVENPSTAVNLMLNGQLSDAAVVGTERQRLAGRGFAEVTQAGSLVEMFFNQRGGHPGADVAVREALTIAVHRDQLRKVLTENDPDNREPVGLVNNEPRACEYDAVRGRLPKHDLAAAKAVLDKAGWQAGAGGVRAKDGTPLKVTLLYPAGTPSVDAGMELVSGWWQEIGVDVELKGSDGNVVNNDLFGNPGSWDVAMLGIGVSFPSQLVSFLSGPPAPSGQNFPGIDNPDYDRLVVEAGRTPGPDGCELWRQAEEALFDRFDVIPLSVGVVRTYLNKTRYRVGEAGPEPTSIRLLAG